MLKTISDYKYISFDVWNTLLYSNKKYAERRTECISDHCGVTMDEARSAYSQVKKFLDLSAEISGICMFTDECWKLLTAILKVDNVNIYKLMGDVEREFVSNLPTFSPDIVNKLREIKETSDVKMGILSNTNFVRGDLLSQHIFNEWNVFDIKIYSDEIKSAKPSYQSFSFMIQLARKVTGYNLMNHDILHVGDNLVCDGLVENVGMDFMHVLNPEDLVKKL